MKGVESMEILDVEVCEIDKKHFLAIHSGEEDVRIPLSDDDPKRVKEAFNKLILRIKEGPFSLRPIEGGEDLFSQVAAEYIKQLNREIGEVRKEMEQHKLLGG